MEYDHIKDLVFTTSRVGTMLRSMRHSLSTIRALKDSGQGVMIVSNRTPRAAEFAAKWLKLRHLPVPFIPVIAGEHKTETIKGLPLSSYTDNDVENLVPLIGHIPHLFLLTTPHNAKREIPDGVTRVKNWTELHERLKEIKQ
jgi:uncharacterized HAD superfamily protein